MDLGLAAAAEQTLLKITCVVDYFVCRNVDNLSVSFELTILIRDTNIPVNIGGAPKGSRQWLTHKLSAASFSARMSSAQRI